MPGTRSKASWRQRVWLSALALVTGVAVFAVALPRAQSEETVDLTLLFNGSVQGKVAPCG